MKLQANLGNRDAQVELRVEGERLFARVDDHHYELQSHNLGSNEFLLLCDGKVFDCRVDSHDASSPFDVFVRRQHYAVAISDPKRLRGASSSGGHTHEVARIIAPMPGKVVRVSVASGASVQIGQEIVTVEAMKMQNEMKSPKDGIVVTLNVSVGETVNAGDVLAVIE
jgi:biotin carboxyl carrier protein